MTRRRLITVSSALLILAVAATAVTGQIAVALDINRFTLHRNLAYTLVGLTLVHVVLVAPVFVRMIKSWLRPTPKGRDRAAPAPPSGGLLERRFALGLGVGLLVGGGAGAAFLRWRRGPEAPPELAEAGDLGLLYHRWSKPSYAGAFAKSFVPFGGPPLYKSLSGMAVTVLPPPAALAGMPVDEAIRKRRSRRGYYERPLSLQQLSDLTHLAAGETDRRDRSWPFRAFPSSGALYPTETYIGVKLVEGLPPGVYHYRPGEHSLALVRAGDQSRPLMAAAMDQEMVKEAALVFVLTSLFDRVRWKYSDRAYRYALIEAGHIGQNLYLATEAMGLGCCAIGAFFDDHLNELVGVDGVEEAAVYMLVAGHSTPKR